MAEYARGKSIGEIMERFVVEKGRGGINSPFNEAVDQVMKAIPDQKWSFGRWCAYLRNIPVDEIHAMLTSALKSENVGRKLNWLIGQYREHEKLKQNVDKK
ncbi:MAG: hypothetical protein ACXW1N_08245 [Halobacteriota archaeon]